MQVQRRSYSFISPFGHIRSKSCSNDVSKPLGAVVLYHIHLWFLIHLNLIWRSGIEMRVDGGYPAISACGGILFKKVSYIFFFIFYFLGGMGVARSEGGLTVKLLGNRKGEVKVSDKGEEVVLRMKSKGAGLEFG
ncbi:hypothetical protein F5Y08DRAFT_315199 [Xylaria arbuscula]|nr:hypothetical protein F5Y08DRAFT_315199 [Xylaria arbuscula]